MDRQLKADIWQAVIEERRRLVEDLRQLTPEQWQAGTACGEWDVHDVLAHLLDTARTTRTSFLWDLVTARMDFDLANARGVARARRDTPEQTLADFADAADRRTGPPANLATRLVEAFVHGEDIRRAAGRTGSYPSALVAHALRYQVRTPVSMGGGKERVAGLRLIADDTDLPIGDGAEVRGPALALLLAVSGRPVADDELRGPGAETLRRGDATWTREQVWAAIHAERAALVEDLTRLEPADWRRPSLCGEWTVEQTAAHLAAVAGVGRLAWIRSIVAAGFRPDVHNRRRLAEHLGATPSQTLENLRAVVTSTTAPLGPTVAWLGEVIVHSEDIRHPLGIGTAPDPAAVVQVARLYAGRSFTVPSAELVRGLRLVADDAPFAAGPDDGDLVHGPVLALTMVMAGHPAHLAQLDGPGTATLRARLTPEQVAARPQPAAPA